MVRKAAIMCLFIPLVFAVVSCTTDKVTQEVNTDSTVAILTPWDNSVREGVVDVKVDAADFEKIAAVELYADGKLVGRTVVEPYNFQWDMTSISTGKSATLIARVIDIFQNVTDSTPLKVTKGKTTTPKATIASPLTGTVTVKQGDPVTFKGSATDADTTLKETSFTWTSNLQGDIQPNRLKNQTADNFQFQGLVIGDHTITLSAANANGVVGTAVTKVKVTANNKTFPITGLPATNTAEYAYVAAGTYYLGQPLFMKSRVTISRPFWISKNEMTIQEVLEYEQVIWGTLAKLKSSFANKRNNDLAGGATIPLYPPIYTIAKDSPLTAKYPNYPATFISYYEACQICNTMSQKEGLKAVYKLMDTSFNPVTDVSKVKKYDIDITANGYRFPTEAEWEIAARGGLSGKKYPWGDIQEIGAANTLSNPSLTNSIVFFNGRGIVPVKSYVPNGYGIYDMAGNVAEYTSDMVTGRTPSGFDPLGWVITTTPSFLVKGGAWQGFLDESQIPIRVLWVTGSANRTNKDSYPGFGGFRVMKPAE